jgi:hypothetical protein
MSAPLPDSDRTSYLQNQPSHFVGGTSVQSGYEDLGNHNSPSLEGGRFKSGTAFVKSSHCYGRTMTLEFGISSLNFRENNASRGKIAERKAFSDTKYKTSDYY